jgi:hypothetical protein
VTTSAAASAAIFIGIIGVGSEEWALTGGCAMSIDTE